MADEEVEIQGEDLQIRAKSDNVQAVCNDCGSSMTWPEAQSHLCHHVRIAIVGLLPRNDIDLDDPAIRTEMAGTIKEALGLAEVHGVYITRIQHGNNPV